MSTESLSPDKPPARPVVRWELWLGAIIGAAGLSVCMLRRGSANDTLLTWLILGSVLGVLTARGLDALLARLLRKREIS
jgi:hypothetical protein